MNHDVFNCKFGNGTCNEKSAVPMKMKRNVIRWKNLNGNECYSSLTM